ncbi:IspD/TarI family cytidylyltransferase [Absicoccus intestinalis]|uniref:2-C-methyl-D-erythritol 4-phosphate cytidylyltransferase n=1 Tax=Absicoccus intestinalis TaxID=2926319 RepID=A0ABU4WPT4_9FIRM|nr:IspD/TarI family cytidylyltransferase [Absicoccus sp. CLA-KB-P134]MDX8417492.1 2-C-methyl-D-erythritol 4-phosphate cytidylyltransferase [Absicoccus sp. CLA-KB-P134]
MNYAIILAGGVGQRMRTSGLPKQFLKVFGKPVIIYTLEKFEMCKDIDKIIISCNVNWLEYMQELVDTYQLKKVISIIPGGKDRQGSIENGLREIEKNGGINTDIVVIHDGVRPLIEMSIISENVRVAKKYGSAMTVKPVIESVVITNKDTATFKDFKKRDDTYSLTSPQTFQLCQLKDAYQHMVKENVEFPILDAALAYTYLGNSIHIVKENNNNIKITTPEDYYILKAMLELEENKYVFGI